MTFNQYIDRVNFHFERLGVIPRPPLETYVEAWNNQTPARKMAETYLRKLDKKEKPLEGG